MAYVSHHQLAERPGARELAEVASDLHQPMVPYELMELTLTGADRSTWPPEQVQLADEALARIDDAVADADGVLEGYLRRGGYSLPLSPVPRLVTVWSRAIARYFLHSRRRSLEADDPIVRDYRDALRLAESVAMKKLSLGVGDEVAPAGTVGTPLVSPGSHKLRDALRDF